MKLRKLTCSLLLVFSQFLCPWVGAQDKQDEAPQSGEHFSVQQLQEDGLHVWSFTPVRLYRNKDGGLSFEGEGRFLLRAEAPKKLSAPGLTMTLDAGDVVFLDQVGQQVRVMALSGTPTVTSGQKQIRLHTSLQVVHIPSVPPEAFIDDGIYRRAPMEQFQAEDGQTIIRQFYLEQVVYTDPLLRTLYTSDPDSSRWIRRLNKRGAVLRDLNGTWGYEEGQV